MAMALVGAIGFLQEVAQPADIALHGDELQVGMAFEHAGENDLESAS